MNKIINLLSKYKHLWLIFFAGLGGAYIVISVLERFYPGVSFVLFICIPTIYGLLKVKNEKIIVVLISFFIVILYFLISQ
jgi:hypothetical protein